MRKPYSKGFSFIFRIGQSDDRNVMLMDELTLEDVEFQHMKIVSALAC